MMKYIQKNITSAMLFAAAVLLCAVSCMKEEALLQQNAVKIKASLMQTRAVQGPLNPGYDQTLEIGMVRIDENSSTSYPLFTNPTGQINAKLNPGKGAAVNTREVEFVDFQQYRNATDNVKFASWYPATNADGSATYDPTKKKVKTPIDGQTDVLFGSISTGNQASGMSQIYFDHALVKYTFNVYAMVQENYTQEQVDQLWGNLVNIKIKGLPKNCEITLPIKIGDQFKDQYDIQYTPVVAPDKEPETGQVQDFSVPKADPKGILLENLPIGAANAQKMTSIIAAPPHDHILEVEVETKVGGSSQKVASKSLTIARNFKRGKNYEIYLRFSDHGLINAEVAVDEWLDGDDFENEKINNEIYYDLSSAENANSYIVTSANYSYCFDVTTRGNGNFGAIDGTPVKINPGYIDVLWMDKGLEDYFEIENHTPIQNRVLFHITNDATKTYATEHNITEQQAMKNVTDKTLSKEGNILFAVWDKIPSEKDAKILWTWHLWVTDRPRDQAYKNGFVVLDRDMGAVNAKADGTTDPKTLDGLYYQWGRPTPLPLGRQINKADATPASQVSSDQSENVDLMTRISHPDKFYTKQLKQDNLVKLWGFRPEDLEYHKTIYDPCPPGYRMGSKRMFDHTKALQIALNTNHKHTYESTVDSHEMMNFQRPLSGFWKNRSNGKLVQQGYFDKDMTYSETSKDHDKFGAYMWTASTNIDDQSIQDGIYSPYDLESRLIGPDNQPVPGPMEKIARSSSHALPVRCVSVRSIPETHDLSSYQTANCYIISKQGNYKFKATVRGNGISKLVAPAGSSSIDVSETLKSDIKDEIYQVVPLWWQAAPSSVQGNEDPNSPNKKPIPVEFIDDGIISTDGYVYFNVQADTDSEFRKGNLIVAGMDIKGQKILWTWHLWLTDEPKIHKSHDFAVMDRYLGATVLPVNKENNDLKVLGSLGFYYQWGRKDPFPGPGSLTVDNAASYSTWWKCIGKDATGKYMWEAKTALDATTKAAEEKTVMHSVEHPMTFHLSQDDLFGGGNIPNGGYFQISNNDDFVENQCFNTLSNRSAMWGYSSSQGFGRTTTKTMYDPCPPGYSVAYYLLWTSASTDENIDYYSGKDYGEMTNPPTKKYTYGIELAESSFDKTWYPFTGYIDSSDGNFREVGTVGRFHSSTPGGNGSRSLYYRKNGSGKTYDLYTGQAVDSGYKGIPSSYAYPVRCQKD